MLKSDDIDQSAKSQMAIYDQRFNKASFKLLKMGFIREYVYRTRLLQQVLALLGIDTIAKDDIWLYIGGGEATQCMDLADRFGGRHVSFDISLGQLQTGMWMLENIAPRYFKRASAENVTFVLGDGEKSLPFADGVGQVAYGLGVLNHLPPTKWTSHVAELARIVKPGGLVFEVVPNPESAFFKKPYMLKQFSNPQAMQYWTQFLSRQKMEEAFSSAGLVNVRSHELWKLDHDSFPGRWWKADFLLSDAIKKISGLEFHPGVWLQKRAVSASEKNARWIRDWMYVPPKHLLVVGERA